jgi:hypothetical protein
MRREVQSRQLEVRFRLGRIVKSPIPRIELHKRFRPEQSVLRGRPEGRLCVRKPIRLDGAVLLQNTATLQVIVTECPNR